MESVMADPQYENSTDQFNPMDSLEKSNLTGMERPAAAALAAAQA
jgi:deoxyhypusine monooxygenase